MPGRSSHAVATLLVASVADALHANVPMRTMRAAPRLSPLHGLRSQIPMEKEADSNGVAPSADVQLKRAKKERLNVRIDDEWYDLTGFRNAHPAGTHWIDAYNGQDATEVMYGFHSDGGMGMVKRMPKSKNPPELRKPVESSYAFREFRRKLEADGWFRPHWRGEVQKLLPWAICLFAAKLLARYANPLAALGAVFFYATSNTLSGWLAHDYVHGRNPFSMAMRGFGELVGGMSTTWWSNKHNMHHALTNEIGYDEDVALEPFIYLWQPRPDMDSNMRKWQHVYWPIPFSVLFLYWRFDSIKYALQSKKTGEGLRLAAHWAAFLAMVPTGPLFLSVWLSGLLTATIVTVTHQSEELFFGENLRKYDFIEAQFRSTRNAKCNNPISHMLWGGMQWQLEHHIFPTMPRYKYPAVSKVLQQFAEEHDISYRVSGEFDIIRDNVALLKKQALAEPVVGNPTSEPVFKQV